MFIVYHINRFMSIGFQTLFSYFLLCVIYATHNIVNITGSGGVVKSLS